MAAALASGVSMEIQPGSLAGLDAALARLGQLGRSPRRLWQAVGAYGEASTRLRFRNQVGPDGTPWKPSARVKKRGGQTLVLSARLLRSMSHQVRDDGVSWGTNVVYARIHQEGGQIQRAAFSSWARLRTDQRGTLLRQKDHDRLAVFAKATHKRVRVQRYTVDAHTITMPARPFLGVNAADGAEIMRLATDVVGDAARPAGGAA